MGKGFSIDHKEVDPSQVKLVLAPRGKEPFEVPISDAVFKDGKMEITAPDFDYRANWTLTVG
ncbi:MAG: hypothetical protein J6P39_02725, partial [Oscillospiraceae bacterium]|nr:hypothetical protein [Oscillospiraceae bacterium]